MKKIIALIMVIVMAVSLCACSNNADTTDTAATKVVVDALGREVEVPTEVNRIVALSNVPRMAVYLGLTDKVVGYSGQEPEEVNPLTAYAYVAKDAWQDVPIVGTDAGGNTDYYPEAIIETNPDVILCCYTEDIVTELESQTGVPVVSVATGNLFEEDYDEAFRIVGDVCNVSDRAEEVIDYIDTCLEDLDQRTSGISDSEKPTVLSAAATFKGVHGIEGVRVDDPVLNAINAVNVAAQDASENNSEAIEVDKEQILAWNPDYIFCDYGGVSLVKQDYNANSNFYHQLKAYQDGHIYQHPSTTSYYTNLEIPLVNCYFIGSILYPEQFADVNLSEKASEIFEFFLGDADYLTTLEEYGAAYGTLDFGGDA